MMVLRTRKLFAASVSIAALGVLGLFATSSQPAHAQLKPVETSAPATLKTVAPNTVAPRTAPAPTPPPTAAPPPPPAIPAVKAKVTMPDQMVFLSKGAYADLLFWSQGVMVQNGIRLTAGRPGFANITVNNAAGFPNGTMNVVVTGSLNDLPGKTIVMASGAQTVTCPIAVAPSTWRCALSIPIGTVGQQQQVSMTTTGTTMLNTISIE